MIKHVVQLLKKHTDQYEVCYGTAESTKVSIARAELESVNTTTQEQLAIRVCIDGKLGSATTTSLQKAEDCVRQALKVARLNDRDPHFQAFASSRKSPVKPCLDVQHYSLADFNMFFRDAKKILLDNNTLKMPRGFYTKGSGKTFLVNSEGVAVSWKEASHSFDYQLVSSDGAANGFAQDGVSSLRLAKIKEDKKLFLSYVHPKTPVTQTMPLLLSPFEVANFLHKVFCFALDGDNLLKKKSPFAGKEKTFVADTSFTLIDDGVKKKGVATVPYDDEGVVAQKTVLINKGKFVSGIYDNYTALQCDKKSTGNCVRGGNNILSRDFTNLVLKPGKKSVDSLLGSLRKGIIVHDVLGLHTMNVTTGDFSVGVLGGHIIEKGSVKHAVKDTMIAGNFYAMLKNIQGISNKLVYANGGSYMPYVLFGDVKVIGK